MMTRGKTVAAIAALLASFIVLFYPVLTKLVYDWSHDDNYSHGFLIVPIAGYFVWERRHALARLPLKGSWLGLVLVGGSLCVLAAGRLGAELFLSRVPIIGVASPRLPDSLPAPDDSDSGDRLQPDRVSPAIAGFAGG
jgi:hypothetical protein